MLNIKSLRNSQPIKKSKIKSLFLLLIFNLLLGNVFATTYYLKAGASMTLTTSWGTSTNGSGTSPLSFGGAHVWNVHNNANVTLSSNFAIASTATLNIGDGTNPINFNFTGSAAFGAAWPVMNVNNNATFTYDRTLSFAYNPAKTTINAGSTFVFTPNSDFIPGDQFGNFINNNPAVYIAPGDVVTVRNLTLSPGTVFALNSASLTVMGTVSGSGQIEGDPYGSSLFLVGSTSYSLNFEPSFEILSRLVMSTTGTITLNTDLLLLDLSNPNSVFQLSNGTLDMSGKYVWLSTCSVTCGAGNLMGNSSSRLDISDNSDVSGTLNFDPAGNTLNAFNFYNGCTGSLTFGSMLNITDSLKIDGVAINANGNLTLKSTNALKARVAEISGGGSLSGNITVETIIPGGTTDWAVLGASGVNGLTFNNWYGAIPMAIEGSATGVTSVSGQYFESVQGWKENDTYGYDTTITISSAITPGKGYWLFVGTSLASSSDITTVVSGTPRTGTQAIPISKSAQNGDCLIANPYASPISWDRVVAGNAGFTTGSIYIYNADLGVTTSYAGGVSSHASGANATIPMGQGFYVTATGTSANLFIDETMKTSDNTAANSVIKAANTTNNIGNIVRLKITDGTFSDETVLRFHGAATAAYDNDLDAKKLFDSPGYVGYPGIYTKRTSISTKSGSLDYSINSLPFAITSNAVIPVLAKAYSTTQHTISASGINNLANGTCVTLHDKLLNINHNLAVSDYVFTLNDTTSAPRFELTVCANIYAGVNELNTTEATEVSVFPNPSNGEFTIKTSVAGKYEIVNQIGKTVFQFEKKGNKNEDVKINSLSSGVYFLKSEQGSVNKKIVVTK